ncbi:MAG: hypothetical protein PVG65_02080, partial [Candidatus Thorarchaeota archaeon]
MTEDIDDIRKELADIREMKEQLKSEIKTLREERREIRKQRKKMIAKEKALRKAEVKRRGHQPPEPPEPPEPVRVPRIELNLDDMTDSLEDMMEGLGEQIEDSLKGLRGIEKSFRLPGVYVRRGKSKRRKKDREIENISPDRVAEVLNPL